MKIIAITDETNICECCGKTNLKKVVVLQKDSGEIVRYGVDCAAKTQGKKVSEVKAEVELVELIQRLLNKFTPELTVKALHNRGWSGARLVQSEETGNRIVVQGMNRQIIAKVYLSN